MRIDFDPVVGIERAQPKREPQRLAIKREILHGPKSAASLLASNPHSL